ncbi:MAG: Uma2 family endonuclease [Chloroflexota bacterium]
MVTAAQPTRRYTVDELDQFPDDGKLRELVDGTIVEWDVPSWKHSALEAELARLIGNFVREHRLGTVGTGEAMVRILGSAHDARGSDIEFVRRGKRSRDEADLPAALTAPDLVVEIISPSDRADRVLDKVHDWLQVGVQLLWYINPDTGTTTVYQGEHVTYVMADEILDGGDVLPGFQVRIGVLLQELREAME